MKSSLRFLLYFVRAFPGRSSLAVLLLAAGGVLEGFGIVTMLPLLELVTGSGERGTGLGEAVAAALARIGLEPSLGILLGIIFGTILAKGMLMWIGMRQVGFTVAHVTTDLRLRLIRSLLAANWGYFVSQPAGHFANAISSEAMRAGVAYTHACRLIAGMIQVAIYVAIVFLASWQLGLLALLGGGLILIVLDSLVRLGRNAGREQTGLMRSLLARLTDALYGIKPIKAMAREAHFRPFLEAETRKLNRALQRQINAVEALRAFQEPLVAFMLLLGLYVVLTYTAFPFSTVVVMAFLFYRSLTYIGQAQAYYQGMSVGESAFWSLRDAIDEAEREVESVGGGAAPPLLDREIRLDRVSFGYGDTEVLRGFSGVIPAGRFTALVGPSGVGKTTLIDLVIGLYRPDSGRITIDGAPLDDLDLRSWRGQIGYVPQEMFLFHDSIHANIVLGDAAISRAEVEAALRAAGAWNFVAALPDGMDTVIGERGAKVSGGQRQRIAIARALVRRPRLLVLDEVTTALDPATEAEICDTLKQLGGEVTVLSISHQPAMMEAADVVIRLGQDAEVAAVPAVGAVRWPA